MCNSRKEEGMKKYKNLFLAILLFMLMSAGICPKILDMGVVDLPEVEQETNMWCWAASMEAVLDVFGIDVSQCEEANWLFSRTDCCSPVVPGDCIHGARGGEQKAVLDHWGLASTLVYSTITWSQLKTEIKASRPINMGWSWCTLGGHSLDIYGFSEVKDGTVKYNVWYMDPWYGEGYNVAEYSWVVGGCPGDHTWYRTIYNIHKK